MSITVFCYLTHPFFVRPFFFLDEMGYYTTTGALVVDFLFLFVSHLGSVVLEQEEPVGLRH